MNNFVSGNSILSTIYILESTIHVISTDRHNFDFIASTHLSSVTHNTLHYKQPVFVESQFDEDKDKAHLTFNALTIIIKHTFSHVSPCHSSSLSPILSPVSCLLPQSRASSSISSISSTTVGPPAMSRHVFPSRDRWTNQRSVFVVSTNQRIVLSDLVWTNPRSPGPRPRRPR